MGRVLFSLCFSLIPLFLGICLPYVPLPGDVRLINLFWGVVYGAGLWAIHEALALPPSRVFLLFMFGWPLAVSGALFFIGSKLQETGHSRLRLMFVYIMIASSLAVTGLQRSLEPPFSKLPTFYKVLFTIY